MIFDVNVLHYDTLEVRWWFPIQWGWREAGTPKQYRYFVIQFPIWWYRKDRYNGAIHTAQDGTLTYRRRWERLVLLWTDFPGLRIHWERTELSF